MLILMQFPLPFLILLMRNEVLSVLWSHVVLMLLVRLVLFICLSLIIIEIEYMIMNIYILIPRLFIFLIVLF